jgi:hypothetical protein
MDSVFSQFSNFRDSIDLSSVFRNSEITRPVQKHLVNVYAGLVVCLLAAVAGVVVDSRINLGGGFLSMMVSFVYPNSSFAIPSLTYVNLIAYCAGVYRHSHVDQQLQR